MNHLRFAAAGVMTFSLFGCGPEPVDPLRQIGANPYLPPIHQYLLPPMHVAKNIGWREGEKPAVPQGLQIEALATGLKNPRSVYVLPNGDVLIVESDGPKAPVNRPKEFVMSWIEKKAHSSTPAGNRILLVRDNQGGNADPGVFLDHLNSPFGVVLVGNDLYVANTDAIMRYHY